MGTKRHVLTDKKGIPLSAVMSSASVDDVELVTDVADNTVDKDVFHTLKQRRQEKENYNTFVLIKHIVPSPKNKQLQNEDMYHIYNAKEKEERSRKIWKRKNLKSQKTSWKKMGHGKNQLMAQQV